MPLRDDAAGLHRHCGMPMRAEAFLADVFRSWRTRFSTSPIFPLVAARDIGAITLEQDDPVGLRNAPVRHRAERLDVDADRPPARPPRWRGCRRSRSRSVHRHNALCHCAMTGCRYLSKPSSGARRSGIVGIVPNQCRTHRAPHGRPASAAPRFCRCRAELPCATLAAQDRGVKRACRFVIVGESAGATQEAEILRALDFLADQGIERSAHPAALAFCR